MISPALRHQLLRVIAPHLAARLREIAAFLDHAFENPKHALVMFGSEGGIIVGEITVQDDAGTLTASVAYLDAKGVATRPADVPVWSSDTPEVASVEAAEDGMSATVTVGVPASPAGSAAVISVVAHDDDGEEIVSAGTVTVQPGDAVIGEVTFA